MSKRFNMLVKIKNKRGDIWNESGAMDCYKNKWALVTGTTDTGLYRLAFLPFINDSLTEDERFNSTSWSFSRSDFAKIEYHCAHCGKKIEIEEYEEQGKLLCADCKKIQEEQVRTRGRSVLLPRTTTYGLFERENYLSNLIETSEILPKTTKDIIRRGISHAEVCRDCGSLIFDVMYRTRDNEAVCEECRNTHYYYCENCNAVMRYEEAVTGMSGRYYCSVECQEADDPFDFTSELPYNAKPPVKFLDGKFDKDKLYLGVEVEVDSNINTEDDKEGCIYDIFKTTKDVYCKHDGSLSSGFEFVSHPATLEYHKNKLCYDKLIATCQDWGYDGDSYLSTGLHIHASRSFFEGKDKEAALKLEMLFEKFWKNFLVLSGRTEEKAERWAKNRYFMKHNFYDLKKPVEEAVSRLYPAMTMDRYTAINVQNAPTIEFRIFKGTTRKRSIFAMLELVDYMCRFVKDADLKYILEASWSEFTAGIMGNDRYRNLKNWMAILDLVPPAMVA